jgi:hypothetical protein
LGDYSDKDASTVICVMVVMVTMTMMIDIMDARNGDCNMMDVALAADPIEKTKSMRQAAGSGTNTRHQAQSTDRQAPGSRRPRCCRSLDGGSARCGGHGGYNFFKHLCGRMVESMRRHHYRYVGAF